MTRVRTHAILAPAGAWLRQAGGRVLDLIVPRCCAACEQPVGDGGAHLCPACAIELSNLVGRPYCSTCGDDRGPHLLIDGRCTDCRGRRNDRAFDRFVRVGPYQGVLRRLILRFKRRFVLDRFLGQLLASALSGRVDPREVDCWVPIPAHWRRRLAVGYQPTALLARAAAGECCGRCVAAVRMTRYLRPFHQSGPLSVARKRELLRGAFQVVRVSAVAGRTVCLVDDVTTTGATLTEARRVLRGAGAARIYAAVLARAGGTEDMEAGVNEAFGKNSSRVDGAEIRGDWRG